LYHALPGFPAKREFCRKNLDVLPFGTLETPIFGDICLGAHFRLTGHRSRQHGGYRCHSAF
jgi:hypothetical protein